MSKAVVVLTYEGYRRVSKPHHAFFFMPGRVRSLPAPRLLVVIYVRLLTIVSGFQDAVDRACGPSQPRKNTKLDTFQYRLVWRASLQRDPTVCCGAQQGNI
jgi:hypothetical protein